MSEDIKEAEIAIDIRDDPTLRQAYHELKDLRSSARNKERRLAQGYDEDSPLSEWQEVIKLSENILDTQQKDLEIAAWFIEGLVRKSQFSGLKVGLTRLYDLIDQHWDDLFPRDEVEGLEALVSPISGLSGYDSPGTLIMPLMSVGLTQGQTADPFAVWQYQQIIEADNITNENDKSARLDTIGYTLADIESERDASSDTFYTQLQQDLQDCTNLHEKIMSIFDEKCGLQAPSATNLRNCLTDVQMYLRFLLKNSHFAILNADSNGASSQNTSSDASLPPKSTDFSKATVSDTISSREQAFSLLNTVADYFASSEPHSPLPYVLRRAVRWGRLPLHELIPELIQDEHSRDGVFQLTGIDNG
jgi:type VI secretion system protein ImpA